MSPLPRNPVDTWLGMLPPPEFIFGTPDESTPDTGLFGPQSVSWQIHSDPVGLLGGIRALLLQALHPEAMAGVAKWSDYQEDPWGRLLRTAEYIGVTTFGTNAEVERAGERVRTVHAKLGVDAPHLLLWVHAGFVDSLLHVHRLAHPEFDDVAANTYVDEQRRAAAVVGLDPETVFASTHALSDYFEECKPELYATADALTAARLLVVPPMAPKAEWLTPARGAWALLASTAFATLPLWAQRMYAEAVGLPEAPAGLAAVIETSLAATAWLRETSVTKAVRGLAAVMRNVPEDRRLGPHARAAHIRLGLMNPN